MRRSFFFRVLLGGILCLCGAARGQVQESRIEKILRPDENQGFNLSKKKEFGVAAYESKPTSTVPLKSAYWPQKFSAKEYLTGSYHEEKSFWMGDFKYSVGEAYTKPRSSLTVQDKNYNTKAVPVKGANGYEKAYTSGTVATRDFRGREREKLNKALSPEQATENAFQGPLTELKSIDDVRALLNKSK